MNDILDIFNSLRLRIGKRAAVARLHGPTGWPRRPGRAARASPSAVTTTPSASSAAQIVPWWRDERDEACEAWLEPEVCPSARARPGRGCRATGLALRRRPARHTYVPYYYFMLSNGKRYSTMPTVMFNQTFVSLI